MQLQPNVSAPKDRMWMMFLHLLFSGERLHPVNALAPSACISGSASGLMMQRSRRICLQHVSNEMESIQIRPWPDRTYTMVHLHFDRVRLGTAIAFIN